MRVLLSICAAASLATALSACATDDGYYGRRGYATAQERCERDHANNRAAGTVVGAGVGALAGNAIGGDTAGTVAGAVVGGVIGNQVTKSKDPCYGYRDGYR